MIPLRDDNPTSRKPYVTIALIVANVLVFLYQTAQGPYAEAFVMKFGLIPYELTHRIELSPQVSFPAVATIFTSMFLHGGWMHLGGNMLYLWIFGNNIEDRLGPIRFLIFYLLSGVCAVLLFVLTGPNTQVPLVGASGAVSGILGIYALRFPRARVLTLLWLGFFVRMVWIPALAFLGIWFAMQLLFSVPTIGTSSGGGVAYMAHVGGFLFGMLGALVYKRRFEGAPRVNW
ncbi:MAG: rhomboid family intramembrane serine protease [Candidatus Zixiibacteriota bacterium]